MKRGIKIIRNAIQCKTCGEILESKSVHDFEPCKCFRESKGLKGVFVDGGHEYRRVGGNPTDYIDLSESRPFTDAEVDEYNALMESYMKRYGWTPNYMEK